MRTPEAVAKLREARRLLRLGWKHREIEERLGLNRAAISTQHKLVRLADGAMDMSNPQQRHRRGRSISSADEARDLVDIFNARPSRKDWGAAEGRD